MAGWDATMLPIRESIVDAVISDIPFGKTFFCESFTTNMFQDLLWSFFLIHRLKDKSVYLTMS